MGKGRLEFEKIRFLPDDFGILLPISLCFEWSTLMREKKISLGSEWPLGLDASYRVTRPQNGGLPQRH